MGAPCDANEGQQVYHSFNGMGANFQGITDEIGEDQRFEGWAKE